MKILTWNISMTAPSFHAPDDWDITLNVFEIIKIIEKEDPDVFCLQEMPSKLFGKRFINYNLLGPVESHSGYVGVFVKKKYKVNKVDIVSPSVLVEVSDNNNNDNFIFVGCHLFPYKQNENIRLNQMSAIFEIINQSSSEFPVIIAGDMNMRESETKSIVTTFSVEDAYIKSGKSNDNKYTWDSRINWYRRDAFQFVCRFDRIFLKKMEVTAFKLVGNKPASENPNHFLSDHFGIAAELKL